MKMQRIWFRARIKKACLVSEIGLYSISRSTNMGIFGESEKAWILDTEEESTLH